MKSFKRLLFVCLLFAGCATGSTVMLVGNAPEVSTPVEQVRLFLEPPTRGYTVIAVVQASAESDDFNSISIAEGAALKKLKEQAAAAGADGVVDIIREIMDGGVVIYSDSLGDYPRNLHSTTTLSRSFSINFRGKAVKFTGQK